MRHYLTLIVLMLGLTVPTAAFAEEPAPEAAEAAEASEEAAPASDEAAAPNEGEEKAEEAEEGEAVPETLDEAADDISLLVKAIQDKDWSLALGLLMMLLVMLGNKFGLKDKVGAKAIPWVAMGMAVASTLGVGLASGVALMDALVQGVLAGVAAIGGWELLFKHMLKSKAAE